MNFSRLLDRLNLEKMIKGNKKEIAKYNADQLPKTLIIAIIINLIPTIISLFRANMRAAFPGYLISFIVSILLFLLFVQKEMRKYALLGFYTLSFLLYLLVIYLGILQYQNQPAGTALTYFAIIPLLFLDRPVRSNLILMAFYAIFVVLSFQYKGSYIGSVDLLNAFISMALGLLFGRVFLVSRLQNFEKDRQLIRDKETDILTGLPNRRKLFETLMEIEKHENTPSGLLLIDVDNFKSYNDRHGHNVGDQCLKAFGEFLLAFETRYDLKFYRYGGEEFIAIVGDECKANLKEIADLIRTDTMKMKMDIEAITISIGVVSCSRECLKDYEQLIYKADKALYVAKSRGRNCVAVFDSEIDRKGFASS